ncbi:hypothetical protein ACI789_09295 [Geodermatophilus sp. SYSU D00965]
MIDDRELDARLAAAAGPSDADLPALPDAFLAHLVADAGLSLVTDEDAAEEPASVVASRQLVADARQARTAPRPRRRRPGRTALLRIGTALVAVAAAWTTAVVVTSPDPTTPPGATATPSAPSPAGGVQLVAAEEATFPLSLDPAPEGLTPAFSWWGGVPYHGDQPTVFAADYTSAEGDRVLVQLFAEDPRQLPDVGWWEPEDLTGTVDVDGAPAVLARADSSAAVLWQRPDGRWVGLAGEGIYADPGALVAVAETVVDRPQPVGLQFGLAPAGWSLGGYEESRSLDLVDDAHPEQPPLRLSVYGGPGFPATVDSPFEGTPLAGPVEPVTIQELPGRVALADGGSDPDRWLVTGQLPGGPFFLLVAPQVLTREQVLQMAEQVTYAP